MSASLLLNSVSARNILAIVSSDLFFDLQAAGELDVVFHSFTLPSDPKYGEVIDSWLESEGIDPDAPMRVADYTLKKFPNVHVQQDYHYGLVLTSSGPGLFRLH